MVVVLGMTSRDGNSHWDGKPHWDGDCPRDCDRGGYRGWGAKSLFDCGKSNVSSDYPCLYHLCNSSSSSTSMASSMKQNVQKDKRKKRKFSLYVVNPDIQFNMNLFHEYLGSPTLYSKAKV